MAKRTNRGRSAADGADENAALIPPDPEVDPDAMGYHQDEPQAPAEMSQDDYKTAREAAFRGGGGYAEAQAGWVASYKEAEAHFSDLGIKGNEFGKRFGNDPDRARAAQFNALLVMTPEETMRAKADICRQKQASDSRRPDMATVQERVDYVDLNYYGTFEDTNTGAPGASLKVYTSSRHNLETLAGHEQTAWIPELIAKRCAEQGIEAQPFVTLSSCDLVQGVDQFQQPFPNKGGLRMNAENGFVVGPVDDDAAMQRAFAGDPRTGQPIKYEHYALLNELASERFGVEEPNKEQRNAVKPDISTILRAEDGQYSDEVRAHALNTARIVETAHRAGLEPGSKLFTSAQNKETVCRAAIGEQTPRQRSRGEPAGEAKGFVQVHAGGEFRATTPFGAMAQCTRGLNPGSHLTVHRRVTRERDSQGKTVPKSPTVKPSVEMRDMLDNRREFFARQSGSRGRDSGGMEI